MEKSSLSLLFSLLLLLPSCRKDDVFVSSETITRGDTVLSNIVGFYLLNEGNMGSNKASLDYYDFTRAEYHRNIYQEANPSIPQSLGDVGNDIAIHEGKLYAIINCSNLVEVMDAATAKHLDTLCCPNCRHLAFADGYGYLTSYAGPVVVDEHYKQRGFVLKFRTDNLQRVDTCLVGFQPDDIEIADGKIYVANSGGYIVPNYENTLSVIDLHTFDTLHRIPVAINLHRLQADTHHQLWVSSRGDYFDTHSRLYCIDTRTDQLIDSLPVPVNDMWLDGDSLYVYGAEFSYETYNWTITYAIINVRTRQLLTTSFITDGTETDIQKPYGIMVHPLTKTIFLTDAKTYVSPGTLHCYSPQGRRLWSVTTGDVPAHMCFRYQTNL